MPQGVFAHQKSPSSAVQKSDWAVAQVHFFLLAPVTPQSKPSIKVSRTPKPAWVVGFCIYCVQMGQSVPSSPWDICWLELLSFCLLVISLSWWLLCDVVCMFYKQQPSFEAKHGIAFVSWCPKLPYIPPSLQNPFQKMFDSLLALRCFWMSKPVSALFRDQSNCCEVKTNIFHLKCHGRSAKQKRIVGNRLETTAGWSVYSSINSSVLMNWVWKLPLYWWRHGWRWERQWLPPAAGRTWRVFIYHLELNDFFGEGSKILQGAVMQLPAAWHWCQRCSSSSGGAGFHPVPGIICLGMRRKSLSCSQPFAPCISVCMCNKVWFSTESARQEKRDCFVLTDCKRTVNLSQE